MENNKYGISIIRLDLLDRTKKLIEPNESFFELYNWVFMNGLMHIDESRIKHGRGKFGETKIKQRA